VGIARAIIHSSDHPSVSAATEAIDRYVHRRNQHFMEHPERALEKIWGKERAPLVSSGRQLQGSGLPRAGGHQGLGNHALLPSRRPARELLSPRAANGLDPLPPDVRWPAVGFDRQVCGIEIELA
jgi:hypothetical protein